MTATLSPQSFKKAVEDLLIWFNKNREEHPWRINPSPYGVWISEIMLQQTTIAAVTEYYIRWMKRFPTISSLAQTSEQEVLREWEGLGYYSRARNLHKTAKLLVKANTDLPQDFQSLLKLPGIGPYTAAAISSIAFGHGNPVIDGNIKRILCRLFLWPHWTKEQESTAKKYLDDWISHHKPGAFNEAMMELGQKICVKSSPRCEECAFSELCLAKKKQKQNAYPLAQSFKQITKKTTLIICMHKKQILMERRSNGLFKDLWIFPGIEGHDKAKAIALLQQQRTDPPMPIELKKINHIYTKFKDQLWPLVFNVRPPVYFENENSQWMDLNNLSDYPMPSVYRKIVNQLMQLKG